ncbi:AhpC-TSA domain-containing protein [Senna tora]|uniref:AhpC-TSA domain-containing protein n=1 Tax=Senna tora TaxID=362788 RepID=A0A834WS14_9FABA|nr:AhpC-TSA domain-containing protein [Senna tora]
MASALGVSSFGSLLVHLPRQLAVTTTEFLQARCVSKLGFHSLQLKKTSSPRRILVRAARTESKGTTLGFRAPEFQLPEPLTGKLWKLEDFEAYPALLVSPIFGSDEYFNYSLL